MAKYKIIPSSRTIVQSPISIGHKAEKGVEAIEFDLTAWVETYGSGTLTVIMRRWGDAIPYPIALEIDENNKATWTLSDIDTAKAGMAYAQLSYVVGDEVVKKSDIYTFRVMDSLTGEGEPPEAYESWLEHLTHLAAEAMAEVLDIEGIVTDKTLTVDGGIADAKATGDALSALEDAVTEETDKLKADLDANGTRNLIADGTHQSRTTKGITFTWTGDSCTVVGTATGLAFTNLFSDTNALPEWLKSGETYRVDFDSTDENIWLEFVFAGALTVRFNESGSVTVPAEANGVTIRLRVAEDSVVNGVISDISIRGAYTNKQLASMIEEIASVTMPDVKDVLPNGTDFDDIYGVNEVWLTSADYTYYNVPSEDTSAYFLFVYAPHNRTIQIAYEYSGGQVYKRRKLSESSPWEEWQLTSGNTIFQTINHYTTEPTYNVTPSITSDTNNFLASTGDTTDVTASIMAMLNSAGICRLGTGVFCVSGVDMPEDSTIIGSGSSTKIILLGNDSDAGYAIKMKSRCTIKNVSILGSTSNYTGNSDVYSSEAAFVERHGILWQGNYSTGNTDIPRRGIVSGCYIANFTGGGITCYDSGLNVISGVTVSDCIIWHCYAGIYIPYRSEFNKFTGVNAANCHYGVINNGGNNCFSNCNFSKNICGFMIDNSLGQSPNNSHGSVTNCIFDHSDNNTGIGIHLLGVENGYVFTGCQLFYSKIVLDECDGVSFVGFDCGRDIAIEITGGHVNIFAECLFKRTPTITVSNNNLIKWVNCFVYDGAAVSA